MASARSLNQPTTVRKIKNKINNMNKLSITKITQSISIGIKMITRNFT
jgi:hypothetical protein